MIDTVVLKILTELSAHDFLRYSTAEYRKCDERTGAVLVHHLKPCLGLNDIRLCIEVDVNNNPFNFGGAHVRLYAEQGSIGKLDDIGAVCISGGPASTAGIRDIVDVTKRVLENPERYLFKHAGSQLHNLFLKRMASADKKEFLEIIATLSYYSLAYKKKSGGSCRKLSCKMWDIWRLAEPKGISVVDIDDVYAKVRKNIEAGRKLSQ